MYLMCRGKTIENHMSDSGVFDVISTTDPIIAKKYLDRGYKVYNLSTMPSVTEIQVTTTDVLSV